MEIYRNAMEVLVENKLDEILKTVDCCKCEHCRNDILTYALNRLPAQYIATKRGEVYSKVYSLSVQHGADVVSEIMNGIEVVRNNPRHDPEERE